MRLLRSPLDMVVFAAALLIPPLSWLGLLECVQMGLPLPVVAAIAFLLPALPFGLALFALRPEDRPLKGPTLNAGRTFGVDWIQDARGTIWVDDATGEQLRQQVGPGVHTPTHSGFTMVLSRSRPPSLAGRTTALLLVFGTLGISLAAVLRRGFATALVGEPMFSMQALLVIPTAAAVVYGFTLFPWWFLVTALFERGTPPRVVQLNGRLLLVNEEPFNLGQSGQEIELGTSPEGGVLRLSNSEEEMVIDGPWGQLAWLAEQVRALPESGDRSAVPVPILALRE